MAIVRSCRKSAPTNRNSATSPPSQSDIATVTKICAMRFNVLGLPRSRKQSLQLVRLHHAPDRDAVRGRAVVAVGGVGFGVDLVERAFHDFLELVVDFLFRPEEILEA